MIASPLEIYPEGVRECEVHRIEGQTFQADRDCVAEEVPVALVFNGISHTVMMATPKDLEDFALGFALSEGILASKSELYAVEQKKVELGIELHLEVSSACAWRLKERRRTLAGRTGCGLCGADSLSQVRQQLTAVKAQPIKAQAIQRAMSELQNWQTLQQLTGATHAAAWADTQGNIQFVREDVGRHNALDKLIGCLVRQTFKENFENKFEDKFKSISGFVCITSRASFEMVQKAVYLGSPLLAAVSAPTALAIETAQAHNLALAGFIRGGKLVAYTFAERLDIAS
jgi:FdhD protein